MSFGNWPGSVGVGDADTDLDWLEHSVTLLPLCSSSPFGKVLARECRQAQREELRDPQDADQVAGDQPGPTRPQRGLVRPRRIRPPLSARKTVSLRNRRICFGLLLEAVVRVDDSYLLCPTSLHISSHSHREHYLWLGVNLGHQPLTQLP